jgi:hypothetical protein
MSKNLIFFLAEFPSEIVLTFMFDVKSNLYTLPPPHTICPLF